MSSTNANGYKAQYKPHAGAQWQTAATGTEMTCLQRKEQLANRYPYTRVVNSAGQIVA